MIESILRIAFAVITLIASYHLTKLYSPPEHWREKVTLFWSCLAAAAVYMLGKHPLFDDQIRFLMLTTLGVILITPDLLTGYLPRVANFAGWILTGIYLSRQPGVDFMDWLYTLGLFALLFALSSAVASARIYWSTGKWTLPIGIGDFILMPLLAAITGSWINVPIVALISVVVTLILQNIPKRFAFQGYTEVDDLYGDMGSAQPAGPGLLIGAILVNFLPLEHFLRNLP